MEVEYWQNEAEDLQQQLLNWPRLEDWSDLTKLKAMYFILMGEYVVSQAKELGIDTGQHEDFLVSAVEEFDSARYGGK